MVNLDSISLQITEGPLPISVRQLSSLKSMFRMPITESISLVRCRRNITQRVAVLHH